MDTDYTKDYYQVLGLDKSATKGDIKKAYHKITVIVHPDKNRNSKESKEKFIDLAAAYELLHDDETRQDYDLHYQSPTIALFKAVVTQPNVTISEIESYLAEGASIDAHNANNQTILHFASTRGLTYIVDFLVRNNATINGVDIAGNTAAIYAAKKELVGFEVDNTVIIRTKKDSQNSKFEDGLQKEWQATNNTSNSTNPDVNQEDITKPPVFEVNFKHPPFDWQNLIGSLVVSYGLTIMLGGTWLLWQSIGFHALVVPSLILASSKEFREFAYNLLEVPNKYFNGYEVKFSFGNTIYDQPKTNIDIQQKIELDEAQKQLYKDKAEVLKILIEKHADILQVNKYGSSALDLAKMTNNTYVLNVFYKFLGQEHLIIPEELIENEQAIEEISSGLVTLDFQYDELTISNVFNSSSTNPRSTDSSSKEILRSDNAFSNSLKKLDEEITTVHIFGLSEVNCILERERSESILYDPTHRFQDNPNKINIDNLSISPLLKTLIDNHPLDSAQLLNSQHINIQELNEFAVTHFEVLKDVIMSGTFIDFMEKGVLPLDLLLEVYYNQNTKGYLWGNVKNSLLCGVISFDQVASISKDKLSKINTINEVSALVKYVNSVVGDMKQSKMKVVEIEGVSLVEIQVQDHLIEI